MITPQEHFDAGLDKLLANFPDVPAVAACLVHDFGRDKIAGAKGVRRKGQLTPVKPTDRFPVGSVSKPITGFLMARLHQAGILRWNDKLFDVFPEFATVAGRAALSIQEGFDDVTVEMLMSQRSGLYDQYNAMQTGRTLSDPPNWPELWFYQDAGPLKDEWLTPAGLMHRRLLLVVQSLQNLPVFPPGQGVGYGPAPTVAAAMAERRTGRTFEELYDAHVFQPLGLTQSSWKRIATTAAPPNGVYEHDSKGTPNDVFAQVQGDWKAHAPVGTYGASPLDWCDMIEQHLPHATGTKARLLDDAEQNHAHGFFSVSDGKGNVQRVTRTGWGHNGSTTDATLSHSGDDGCQYATFVIHRTLGYGLGVTVTIKNSSAVSQLVAYLEDMATNWANLF